MEHQFCPELKCDLFHNKTCDICLCMSRDINGDSQVNLADGILSLQVLARVSVPEKVRSDYRGSDADVNGDGRVGLEELICILQKVCEER